MQNKIITVRINLCTNPRKYQTGDRIKALDSAGTPVNASSVWCSFTPSGEFVTRKAFRQFYDSPQIRAAVKATPTARIVAES